MMVNVESRIRREVRVFLGASMREIYYYAVSFVMLILVVIGLFQLVSATIALFEPAAGMYRYPTIAGEAEIRARLASQHPEATDEEIDAMVRDELARLERIEAEERARANYWRWQRLVNAAAFIVIALPIYRYHWRKVRANP